MFKPSLTFVSVFLIITAALTFLLKMYYTAWAFFQSLFLSVVLFSFFLTRTISDKQTAIVLKSSIAVCFAWLGPWHARQPRTKVTRCYLSLSLDAASHLVQCCLLKASYPISVIGWLITAMHMFFSALSAVWANFTLWTSRSFWLFFPSVAFLIKLIFFDYYMVHPEKRIMSFMSWKQSQEKNYSQYILFLGIRGIPTSRTNSNVTDTFANWILLPSSSYECLNEHRNITSNCAFWNINDRGWSSKVT